MKSISPTVVADINRHHELACLRAGEAVHLEARAHLAELEGAPA